MHITNSNIKQFVKYYIETFFSVGFTNIFDFMGNTMDVSAFRDSV